jgi:hypothetical protein
MKFLIPLLLLLMFACNNEDIPCSYNAQFCSAVGGGDMQEAGNYINDFLSRLPEESSDPETIQLLENWLKCKVCVESVEVFCVSCMYSMPPQSSIKFSLRSHPENLHWRLDIIMGRPAKYARFLPMDTAGNLITLAEPAEAMPFVTSYFQLGYLEEDLMSPLLSRTTRLFPPCNWRKSLGLHATPLPPFPPFYNL